MKNNPLAFNGLQINFRILLNIMTLINMKYLVYKILNPDKVVKVKFIKRDMIRNDCKTLDGYFYSYEGSNIKTINKLVKSGYIKIIGNKIYDFAYIFDPPTISSNLNIFLIIQILLSK